MIEGAFFILRGVLKAQWHSEKLRDILKRMGACHAESVAGERSKLWLETALVVRSGLRRSGP